MIVDGGRTTCYALDLRFAAGGWELGAPPLSPPNSGRRPSSSYLLILNINRTKSHHNNICRVINSKVRYCSRQQECGLGKDHKDRRRTCYSYTMTSRTIQQHTLRVSASCFFICCLLLASSTGAFVITSKQILNNPSRSLKVAMSTKDNEEEKETPVSGSFFNPIPPPSAEPTDSKTNDDMLIED